MKSNKLVGIVVATALLASFASAATSKAIVRQRLGEVNHYLSKKNKWEHTEIGHKVFAYDSLTTATESDVTLSMPDGSMLTIRERSKVVFSEFYEEDGNFKTNVNVVAGNLKFSVQKQNGNSSFKFSTGTMAAAIRGTDGCIAGGDVFLAGLKTGALQVDKANLQTVLIHGGQIVFDRDSLIVMNVASAGEPDFHEQILKLLTNKEINKEDLIQQIKQADEKYKSAVEEAQKNVQCYFEALPDTISNQEIQVHGHCSAGASVKFFGEEITLESNGSFLSSVSLDSCATGEKLFRLSCSAKGQNFDCAEARTYYKPQAAKIQSQMIVTSKVPATICDDGLSVEGTYQTTDSAATLIMSIGNSYKSTNLMKIPDGKPHPFSQNISMTDRNGLWNAKMAILEFDADGKKISKEVPLNVKRTCQAVNQMPPYVQVNGYDSLVCAAYVSVGGLQDDMGIFRTNIDNVEGKSSILDKNTSTKISLKPGIHDYEFIAKDQAGNEAAVTKTMGCFPDKFFKVEVKGNKEKETTWVPPGNPANHSEVGKRIIKKTLRFKIDLSDVSEVYSVTVKQNGVNILHETLGQIESLDYDVPVELVRGKTHKLEITVKHKSGHVAKATKVYEVK